MYTHAKGKTVYYLIAQHELPRDATPSTIDLPREESAAGRADAIQRQQLQRTYRESVQSTEHFFYAIQSHPETELSVRRLKDELDKLRRGFRNWMIGVAVALVLIAAGIGFIQYQQGIEILAVGHSLVPAIHRQPKNLDTLGTKPTFQFNVQIWGCVGVINGMMLYPVTWFSAVDGGANVRANMNPLPCFGQLTNPINTL